MHLEYMNVVSQNSIRIITAPTTVFFTSGRNAPFQKNRPKQVKNQPDASSSISCVKVLYTYNLKMSATYSTFRSIVQPSVKTGHPTRKNMRPVAPTTLLRQPSGFRKGQLKRSSINGLPRNLYDQLVTSQFVSVSTTFCITSTIICSGPYLFYSIADARKHSSEVETGNLPPKEGKHFAFKSCLGEKHNPS